MKTQVVKLNYLKMAPRKVRLVANTLRGLPVNEAEARLSLFSQRSAGPLLKLLRSAINNAKNNQQLLADNLIIKEVRVDEGPSLKRFRARAMGRGMSIHKKSSHVTLVLAQSDKTVAPRFKVQRIKRVVRKEEVEKAKKERARLRESDKDTTKSAGPSRPSFIRKIFRRKAI